MVSRLFGISLVVGIAAVVAPLRAQTIWQGEPGGSWLDEANWSAGAPKPNANSTDVDGVARIENGDVVEISVGAAEATRVDVHHGTLNLTGGELHLKGWRYLQNNGVDGVPPSLRVGTSVGETSVLNVSGGAKIVGHRIYFSDVESGVDILIGSGQGFSGELHVEGPETLVDGFQVYIGAGGGSGELTVTNGARLNGSLHVGSQGGSGFALIDNGATVVGTTFSIGGANNAPGYLAGQPEGLIGEGRVVVSGEGTTVRSGLSIGHHADNGYLRIEDGARFEALGVRVGHNDFATNEPGGEGTVVITGDNSSLSLSPTEQIVNGTPYLYNGAVYIGFSDKGSITVADGGTLSVIHSDEADYGPTEYIVLGYYRRTVLGGTVYDGQGTLRIGEGGRAGTVIAEEVRTGEGRGEIIFDHNETAYGFAPRIATSTQVTALQGRTILSGANTYNGDTTIAAGATLVGAHTTAFGDSEITVYGTLEVDAGLETLSLGTYLSMEEGSTIKFTISPDAQAGPILEVEGAVDFWAVAGESFANFELLLPEGFDVHSEYEWTFLYAAEGIYGFDPDAARVNLAGWSVSQSDDYSLTLSYSPVPEPSTWMLLGGGVVVALLIARRRVRALD